MLFNECEYNFPSKGRILFQNYGIGNADIELRNMNPSCGVLQSGW